MIVLGTLTDGRRVLQRHGGRIEIENTILLPGQRLMCLEDLYAGLNYDGTGPSMTLSAYHWWHEILGYRTRQIVSGLHYGNPL